MKAQLLIALFNFALRLALKSKYVQNSQILSSVVNQVPPIELKQIEDMARVRQVHETWLEMPYDMKIAWFDQNVEVKDL